MDTFGLRFMGNWRKSVCFSSAGRQVECLGPIQEARRAQHSRRSKDCLCMDLTPSVADVEHQKVSVSGKGALEEMGLKPRLSLSSPFIRVCVHF